MRRWVEAAVVELVAVYAYHLIVAGSRMFLSMHDLRNTDITTVLLSLSTGDPFAWDPEVGTTTDNASEGAW